MKKLLALVTLVVSMAAFHMRAVEYRSINALQGTNLVLYFGTNGGTFAYDDTYNTNRTYMFGTNVITPLATNSATGGIYPQFPLQIPSWANAAGDTSTNRVIYVSGTANSTFTNTVAFTFIRSVDGTNYDTAGGNTFSFTLTPSSTNMTTLITNMPGMFLTGAGYILLQKVVPGTNGAANSVFTVNRLRMGGFVP